MKRIYLLLSFAFLASSAMAQIDVTFAVDMSNETVSANGLHVAGNWQDAANGGGGDWLPGANEMTDAGGGLYTLTVNIPAGGYEFKYINDNNWGAGEESIPAVSQVGFGNGNRYFQITAESNGIDTVPFSGSAMPGLSAIKVMVDMSDEGADANGVFVAGDLITPAWSPAATPLYNLSNLVYGAVIQVANGDYQYKFVNGDNWEAVSDDCGTSGNRTVAIAGDMEDGPNCFNFCGPCAIPTNITFKVNVIQSCLDYVTEGVNLMGTATDWDTGEPMDDSDGDGIYEITLGLQPGDYSFKFKIGGTWEGIGDRPLTVVDGVVQVLDPVCFGSADECSIVTYEPADLTFNCDVNDSTLGAGEFVWLMADFTDWQGGAIQMTDGDGDGIWSTTVADFCPQSTSFKFVIGTDPPEGEVWLEENADFSSIGGCGTDNGADTDNRTYTRSSNNAEMLCFTFNTCDDCLLGIEELESLNRVEVYPNPVVGDINIVFENSGAYSIRVLDVTGKLVLSTEVNAARTAISSESLISGVYLIQITDNDNNTVTRKIVK